MLPALDALLRATDPAIADLIVAEEVRERDTIRLIASENYAPRRCWPPPARC